MKKLLLLLILLKFNAFSMQRESPATNHFPKQDRTKFLRNHQHLVVISQLLEQKTEIDSFKGVILGHIICDEKAINIPLWHPSGIHCTYLEHCTQAWITDYNNDDDRFYVEVADFLIEKGAYIDQRSEEEQHMSPLGAAMFETVTAENDKKAERGLRIVRYFADNYGQIERTHQITIKPAKIIDQSPYQFAQLFLKSPNKRLNKNLQETLLQKITEIRNQYKK